VTLIEDIFVLRLSMFYDMQVPRTVTLAFFAHTCILDFALYRRKVPLAAIASSQIRTISFHQFAV